MKWNWLIFLFVTHDIAISFGFEKTMEFNKIATLGVGLEMQEIIPNYFGRKFLHTVVWIFMPGRKILYVSRVRCVTGESLNYLMLVMMVLFGDIVLMF